MKLFLIRNPFDFWASYRRNQACVLRVWPEEMITTPEQFGSHWLNLAGGFCNRFQDVGGLLVHYEKLADPLLNLAKDLANDPALPGFCQEGLDSTRTAENN
jgi:hypothetical protein